MKTSGDQQLVKRINRSLVLRLVRSRPGLSRARLAAESGLTKSTVSALVRELIDEGWLCEADAAVADGLGRPSTPLALNVAVHALVGVEVALDVVRVVIVSLRGEVLHADERPTTSTRPAPICKAVARGVARACGELQARGLSLAGVGVGLPGAIDDATGVVRFAPNLGWHNVDVLPMLKAALAAAGVPQVTTLLQNEADMAALSEFEFEAQGEGEAQDPLVFVNCDVGVGAGIVLNDRLFTGAHGMAGEIGHTVLQVDGPRCSCGRSGCAEVFIGSRALARPGGIEQGGHYLGVLLQNLWTTFNPRTIVTGGSSCVGRPELLERAVQAVNHYAEAAGMPPPTLRAARYGLLAVAVGGAALVLHQHLRPLNRPSSGWPLATELPGSSLGP